MYQNVTENLSYTLNDSGNNWPTLFAPRLLGIKTWIYRVKSYGKLAGSIRLPRK